METKMWGVSFLFWQLVIKICWFLMFFHFTIFWGSMLKKKIMSWQQMALPWEWWLCRWLPWKVICKLALALRSLGFDGAGGQRASKVWCRRWGLVGGLRCHLTEWEGRADKGCRQDHCEAECSARRLHGGPWAAYSPVGTEALAKRRTIILCIHRDKHIHLSMCVISVCTYTCVNLSISMYIFTCTYTNLSKYAYKYKYRHTHLHA